MSFKISPLSKQKAEKKLLAKDYLVSNESFDLYYDSAWDMMFTDPQPENLSKYYESKEYKPHEHQTEGLLNKIYNLIRKTSYGYKLSLIKKARPNTGNLLDYGTATGEFLAYLAGKNFEVAGVEPHPKARKKANEILSGKVKSSIEEINGKFDVITLWHVLEHIRKPDELIRKLKEKLRPDGVIIVAVPNFKSYDAQHYQSFWAAYDVPRHLWHFSPKAIEKLFERHQLKVIDQKPLFFDSFYVSLLSEQYKTGKKRIFPAFVTGLKSNLKALSSRQYSSLIYVIK